MTDKPRSHETTVEIHATPDEVFRAITEADQIVKWFAPYASVEPGPDGKMVGGTYTISWSGPGGDPSTISAWDPPRHFGGYKERSIAYGCDGKPVETGETQRVAVDSYIEAIDGSTTRLRLVQSGFGPGGAWDEEYESTKTGWRFFLDKLKQVLEGTAAAA